MNALKSKLLVLLLIVGRCVEEPPVDIGRVPGEVILQPIGRGICKTAVLRSPALLGQNSGSARAAFGHSSGRDMPVGFGKGLEIGW